MEKIEIAVRAKMIYILAHSFGAFWHTNPALFPDEALPWKEQGMTQEQLAQKCGTTKTYISRIENDASDIRLSTLMRIIRQGFGKRLKMSVEK
jgi:DNA-binding XRE family transcriptional regulator